MCFREAQEEKRKEKQTLFLFLVEVMSILFKNLVHFKDIVLDLIV